MYASFWHGVHRGLEGVGWALLELQIKAVRADVGEFGWQLRSQILQILVGVLEFGGVAHCLLTCFLKELAALWDPLICNKRCSASSITHLFYTAVLVYINSHFHEIYPC